MIRIICLGKIKEKYLNALIDDYTKRISKYHKIEIIELKDLNDLEKEADSILKYINPKDYTVCLTPNGKMMNSIEFSEFIDKAFLESGTINFIIGSSEGISNKVYEKANLKLSFSNLTFPHGLFRGILLEQIYRAFKIINHETYHK